MRIINNMLSKYKSTEAICRFLNPFSEPGRPSSIKSRILFILGVKKYVFIRKLIAIAIPNIIPETKSPKEKNKNINIEIKKQKLKRRGKMYLKNFFCSIYFNTIIFFFGESIYFYRFFNFIKNNII